MRMFLVDSFVCYLLRRFLRRHCADQLRRKNLHFFGYPNRDRCVKVLYNSAKGQVKTEAFSAKKTGVSSTYRLRRPGASQQHQKEIIFLLSVSLASSRRKMMIN
jgi:hypothetical protein